MSSLPQIHDKGKKMLGDIDILFSNHELCESIIWLIKGLADPIKLDILKELAKLYMRNEKVETSYYQLCRKLKVSNRPIQARLREMEERNENTDLPTILTSKWEERTTATNPKVKVRIYTPNPRITPLLKLLAEM